MDRLTAARIGLLLNSAVYLVGCFAAGVIFATPLAWKAALLTAALCYLAYLAHEFDARWLVAAPVVLSIFTGAVAGLSLLLV